MPDTIGSSVAAKWRGLLAIRAELDTQAGAALAIAEQGNQYARVGNRGLPELTDPLGVRRDNRLAMIRVQNRFRGNRRK